MKTLRKLVSLLLTLCFVLTALSVTAFAENAKAPLKLRMLVPNNTNQFIKFDEREEYPVWQELKKLFAEKNLEIEFEVVSPDQYPTTAQTRIASGNNLPDIMNLSSFDDASAMELANKGIILPINQIVNEYSDGTFNKFYKEQYPFMEQLTTAPDGNIYWFTSIQAQTYENKPAPTCRVINIRKDWLEKLNLPVPTTADEFVKTLKAFQENDMNQNGLKDEIVTVDTSGDFFMTGIAQWFGLGNYLTAVDVKNEKIVTPWYQEGIKDYIKFMQLLVKEGLLDTDLIGATYEQVSQRMAENKVGATFDYCMQMWLEPSINQEGAEFLPIALLTTENNYTPYNIIEPPFFSWHKWVVTKDCQNKEAVAAFLDVIYSARYEELTAWGIEGKTYEVVDGSRQLMAGVGGAFWEQNAKDRNTAGGNLWSGCVFPTVSLYTMESQFSSRPEHKNAFQKQVAFYDHVYPDAKYCYVAIAENEQNERKAEIVTDLSTYSSELITDFVLGRADFEKWDEYMSQLQKLGLDELMAIEQAQFDKFLSFSK